MAYPLSTSAAEMQPRTLLGIHDIKQPRAKCSEKIPHRAARDPFRVSRENDERQMREKIWPHEYHRYNNKTRREGVDREGRESRDCINVLRGSFLEPLNLFGSQDLIVHESP